MNAQAAAYQVFHQQLRNASPIWGTRVQPLTTAGATLARPYVVFFLAAGGRNNSVPSRHNARLVVSVKIVAETMQTALDGAEAISMALANSGSQDINPRLPTHEGWQITTVTEDRTIWIEEKFEGALSIYHAGAQYIVTMEAK